MLKILPKVIYQEIQSYLPFISLLALRLTCHQTSQYGIGILFRDIVKKHLVKRFHHDTEQEKWNEAENLLTIMNQHKIFLHGSFVLECLFDEDWSAQDLDFVEFDSTRFNWVHDESPYFFTRLRQQVYLKGITVPIYSINDNSPIYDETIQIDYFKVGATSILQSTYDDIYDVLIASHYPYTLQNEPLPQYRNVWEFLVTEPDLDICKNAFDCGNQLYIYDLNCLVEKKCTSFIENYKTLSYYAAGEAFSGGYNRMDDRIKKYRERGFIIIDSTPQERSWFFLYQKAYEVQKKSARVQEEQRNDIQEVDHEYMLTQKERTCERREKSIHKRKLKKARLKGKNFKSYT